MIERHPEGVPVVEQSPGERGGLGMAHIGVQGAQIKEGVERVDVSL